jgi:predicted HAD superfamily phosphohydrolase
MFRLAFVTAEHGEHYAIFKVEVAFVSITRQYVAHIIDIDSEAIEHRH